MKVADQSPRTKELLRSEATICYTPGMRSLPRRIVTTLMLVAGTFPLLLLTACASEDNEKPKLGEGEVYAPRPDNRTLKRDAPKASAANRANRGDNAD